MSDAGKNIWETRLRLEIRLKRNWGLLMKKRSPPLPVKQDYIFSIMPPTLPDWFWVGVEKEGVVAPNGALTIKHKTRGGKGEIARKREKK